MRIARLASIVAPLSFLATTLVPVPVAWAQDAPAANGPQVRCDRCHNDPEFLVGKGGSPEEDVRLLVPPSLFEDTVHAKLACSECHLQYDDAYPHQPVKVTKTCAQCHEEQGRDWNVSVHGLDASGRGETPDCMHCHGVHRVLGADHRESRIHPLNEAALCAECHADSRIIDTYFTSPADSTARTAVETYHKTVHGIAASKMGLIVTATCSDCHRAHRILPSEEPASSVNPANIPTTCGGCHTGVSELYDASAHGVALAEGKKNDEGHGAPVCTNCHSAHEIAPVNEPWKAHVVEECGHCHERLYETYFETYHGKVTRLGGELTAKCSDCHTPHSNLPASDANSTVNARNLVATCSQCHPDASPKFVEYHPHGDHRDAKKFPEIYWSYTLMSGLLVGTLSFFGLHTVLWLGRGLAETVRPARGEKSDKKDDESGPGGPDSGEGASE
ncbi:MAG: hypothetical protein R3B81_05940 [bacterium]